MAQKNGPKSWMAYGKKMDVKPYIYLSNGKVGLKTSLITN